MSVCTGTSKPRKSGTYHRDVHTFLVVELDDDADGPKDLLSHDFHVRSGVREYGGLDEVALRAVALAPDENVGAVCFTRFDVAHDAVELCLGDLRSLVRPRRERVADFDRASFICELFEKLVVVDPGSRAAGLSVVVGIAQQISSIPFILRHLRHAYKIPYAA